MEYSIKWTKNTFPTFVKVLDPALSQSKKHFSQVLSQSDISILLLALEYKALLATDDKRLREEAKKII